MHNCFSACTKILLFTWLLLQMPASALTAQNKPGKKTFTTKQVSAIPAVQRIIADSLAATYGLNAEHGLPSILSSFDTAGNQYHKSLYRYIKQKAGLKEWKKITENARQLNPVKGAIQQFTSLLPGLYALKNKTSFQRYNPFTNTSFQLHQTELQAVTGNQFGLQNGYTSAVCMGGTLNIAGVPLSAKLQTDYPAFFGQQPAALFKFSFDKTGFQQKIKQNLNEQFDLKKYALSGFDFERILKDYAQSFTQDISRAFSGLKEMEPFISRLNNMSVEEILYLSADQLDEKIFAAVNQQQLAVKENIHPDSLQQMIVNCKTRIRGMKQEFGKNGINMNALVQYQQLINKNVDSLTSTPDFINNSARELLTMTGLSRFFTKMKNFNLGQFSSGWSEKTISGIFMSGIGGDFQGKQMFAGLNIFENKPLAVIRDNQFNSVLDNPNQFVQATRIGNGALTGNHTHLTALNGKTFNRNRPGDNQMLALPRNNFAGTLSNSTSFGKAGTLATEISKSSSAYQNGVTDIDGQLAETASALNGFTQDFWQTISFGLNYQKQYKKIALDHQFSFNYAGIGYNNPGSAFNGRGVLQAGTVVKKNFYKNKGVIFLRYQRRNNYTNTEKNHFFKQDRLNISAKWKFNRQLRVGLSWNSAAMQGVEGKIQTAVFSQTRGSFDANYNGKINNKPFQQFVTAGYQHFSYAGNAGELPGKMLIINSASNLSVKKMQLQVNLQYLRDASAISGQNNLFTSDAGLAFSLSNSIQVTSSITYLSQTRKVKQLGIRNALNGQLGRKWQLSAFGDFRKNLVENQNPLFFPAVRGEIMLQYLIQ